MDKRDIKQSKRFILTGLKKREVENMENKKKDDLESVVPYPKNMKNVDITPNIIKNFVYLKTHSELNEYYLNFKTNNRIDVNFAISHFNYTKRLVNDILEDLEIIKEIN